MVLTILLISILINNVTELCGPSVGRVIPKHNGNDASPEAVNFDCNDRFKCREIVLQDVDLRGDNNNVGASCKNVEFTKIGAIAPLCPDDVITSSTSTPSQPPVTHSVDHPSISVDDFGAKGNGKGDDTDVRTRTFI